MQPRLILWVRLPVRVPSGHEQKGLRPCILIKDPSTVHPIRFPVLLIAPLTSQLMPEQLLYPRLKAGVANLPVESTVLLDQLMTIDCQRVEGYIGTLEPSEYEIIRTGLLGLWN